MSEFPHPRHPKAVAQPPFPRGDAMTLAEARATLDAHMDPAPQHEPETVLEEAARLTSGVRDGIYGHPFDDWTRTAKLFSGILGFPVTAEQAILCMCAVKISRLCASPGHRDSIVDLAGYARCYERVRERRPG